LNIKLSDTALKCELQSEPASWIPPDHFECLESADMGVFFDANKIGELVKYESSLPIWHERNLRGYCF